MHGCARCGTHKRCVKTYTREGSPKWFNLCIKCKRSVEGKGQVVKVATKEMKRRVDMRGWVAYK